MLAQVAGHVRVQVAKTVQGPQGQMETKAADQRQDSVNFFGG